MADRRSTAFTAALAVVALGLTVLALQPPEPPTDASFQAPPTRTVPALPQSDPVTATGAGSGSSTAGQLEAPQALVRFTPAPAEARVLFAGGLITQGLFASTPEAVYTSRVAAQIREEFAVRSVDVRTVSAASADLAAISSADADEDLVVLEVGTSEETALRPFLAQYAALTQRVREQWPDAALICLGIWGGAGNPYDIEIARLCRRSGGAYVEMADLYGRNAFRGPVGTVTPLGVRDDFHPNDGGHAAIADRVVVSLQRELAAEPTPAVKPQEG